LQSFEIGRQMSHPQSAPPLERNKRRLKGGRKTTKANQHCGDLHQTHFLDEVRLTFKGQNGFFHLGNVAHGNGRGGEN